MDKQKYLAELGGLLSSMTVKDRQEILRWVEKQFDKAGADGEVIARLGTPMRFVIDLNRRGMEEVLVDEEEPAAQEEAEAAEEASAEEAEVPAEEAPVEEEVEAPAKEEAPAEETEEAAEEVSVEEQTDTAQLIAAVLAEPDPEPEKPDESEESQVTDEIEELPPAEEETTPQPEEKEDPREESFPELAVALGIEKAPEEPKKKFSILGAIGFFILAIVPGLPLLALSIVAVPLLLVPGCVLGWMAAVAAVAGVQCLVYIPDAIFMFGAALVLGGLAVLLVVLTLWLDWHIIVSWVKGVPGLWKRLTRKERS